MRNKKRQQILFWVSTGLLSLGMVAGGIGQIGQAKFNVEGVTHLGYPAYMLYIIGSWKLIGILILLLPGYLLLKEWAYAGFFFLMTGALISHIVSGDNFVQYIAPLIFACLTVTSWYLRPADRRLINPDK